MTTKRVSFLPLYDKLLVQKDPQATTIAGDILLPESAKEKPETGTVLAAGHGRLLESGRVLPLQVKAGDRILFGKWAGSEFPLLGKDRLILDESEVLGILDPEVPQG